MASENKLQDIIQTSLENMRNLVDANTIIGTPIETASGTTLIPVSKISVGLATGGLDGSSAHPDKPVFGGGGGTGMSIKPVAFMIVYADGRVEIQNLGMQNPPDPLDSAIGFIDRVPELVDKIKALFGKKRDDKDSDESETDAKEEPKEASEE